MAHFLPDCYPRCIAILCCVFLFSNINGQRNLLLNGDFEDLNNCAEYHSECGVEAWFYLNASRVELTNNQSQQSFLGNNTLSVYFKWQRINSFTPVIGTLLPCSLQEGKEYIFKGIIGATINAQLNMKLGVALGPVFYVQRRPFTEKMQPDSILDIVKLQGQDLYDFEYYFTATGNERYITLGVFVEQDTSRGKFMSKGSDIIKLTLDNFELVAEDLNEIVCPAFETRKTTIYSYDWRHKIMDNTLYAKGELPIPLPTNDSASITVTQPPPKPIITDTIKLGDVLFDFNKSTLTPKALKMLITVFAQQKLSNPDSIYVEGHTDSIGGVDKNIQLSQNRSLAVKRWLLQQGILPEEKVQVRAFGKSRPVATNATLQGRSQNRRVELVIFRKE
jgi:outer membrane protein OmpA-like peptidoglycan-associated protein